MTTTDHDLARQIAAMRTDLAHTRKLVEQLAATLARTTTTTSDATVEGVRTLPDGRVFIPGTGTLGHHDLSDEAQAALDQLNKEHADT